MSEKIAENLYNINQTLVKILGVLQKPENKIVRGLEIFGLVVSALSILYFVDMIRRWNMGE